MDAIGLTQELESELCSWLESVLDVERLEEWITRDDPVRLWWSPRPAADAVRRFVSLLNGGGDLLTLLAVVAWARITAPVPRTIDEGLAIELTALARAARTPEVPKHESGTRETFVSYAHEDADRVTALSSVLEPLGVTLLRDVERIRPGENISLSLHSAMNTVRSAIVVISQHSVASEWVAREVDYLLQRREGSGFLLLPILVDDLPLPHELADVFTIDLRGYRGVVDNDWATTRLRPLVDSIGRLNLDATGDQSNGVAPVNTGSNESGPSG